MHEAIEVGARQCHGALHPEAVSSSSKSHTHTPPSRKGIFFLLHLNQAPTPTCILAGRKGKYLPGTISYVYAVLWPSYSAAFWNCQSLTYQSLLVSAGFYYSSQSLLCFCYVFSWIKNAALYYMPSEELGESDEWALWKCKRSGLRSCCTFKFILMCC